MLRPVGTLSGTPWNAAVRAMNVDSSNAASLGRGCLVKLEDDGNIANCAAGDAAIGVVVGVKVDAAVAATIHPGYLPASTAGVVLVAIGRDIIYSVEEDHVGGNMALTNIGSMGDIVAGSLSTTTGNSGHVLDTSDVIAKDATPGSAQLRVLDVDPTVGNELSNAGTSATRWLVTINESQLDLGGSGL